MATKKTGGKKQAPIRRAGSFMREAPAVALRLLMFMVVTVITGLLLSVIQGIGNAALRIALAALLSFAVLRRSWEREVDK